nr:MAG TPA_asm: hypothetical protein [Caudoviricetes sp.]DAL57240.1 MAG TPA_asm: hypothetical protein [Caudoviricetes sp.]
MFDHLTLHKMLYYTTSVVDELFFTLKFSTRLWTGRR